METKDLIPILISLAALGVSLLVLLRERGEERRMIRGQITDIASKLLSTVGELDRVREEFNSGKGNRVVGNQLDRLKRQSASLAEYAEYLIQERPDLAIAIDYATLAAAFENAGVYDKAGIYWKKSIESYREDKRLKDSLGSQMWRGVNTRRYAELLFNQNKVDEGRKQFNEAIKLFAFEQDQARWEKGFTYVKWARKERQIQQIEAAQRYLHLAEEAYNAIQDEARRTEALASLQPPKEG